MRKYKYIGKTQVEIAHVGIIEPNSIVETTVEINNPLFEEIKSKEVKK